MLGSTGLVDYTEPFTLTEYGSDDYMKWRLYRSRNDGNKNNDDCGIQALTACKHINNCNGGDWIGPGS